jgi:hypothetical protein
MYRATLTPTKMLLSAAGFKGIAVFARGNPVTVAWYKVMAVLLRLAMPQSESLWKRVVLRATGLPTLHFFIVLALIGNISLFSKGGDHCLGHTAVAFRS